MAEITVVTKDSMRYKARPLFYLKDNKFNSIPDTVFAQNLAIALSGVENYTLQVAVKESSSIVPFISLKVYEFPQINILWIGTLIMIVGFVMSIVRRVKTRLIVK